MKTWWMVLSALALGVFGYLALSVANFTGRAERSLSDIADSERHESPQDVKGKARPHIGTQTFGDPVRAAVPAEAENSGERAERAAVRDAQLRRLLELGFHKAAGCSEEEFAKLAPLPVETDAVLVVSEKFISVDEQCRLLGIANLLEEGTHHDLFSDRSVRLYWRYGADAGGLTLGVSVVEARGTLMGSNRVPASVTEVLALHREDPTVGVAWGVDAPGTMYDRGRNPYLWYDEDKQRLELGMGLSNRGHALWGSASFAK